MTSLALASSSSSPGIFHSPVIMILLMLLLVHCGSAQAQTSVENQRTKPLSSLTKVTTSQEDVKGESNCCKTGTFYATKNFLEFLKSDLAKQIREDYTMGYCGVAPVLGLILNEGDAQSFCKCDCQYGHGASQSDLKCDGSRDYPCACTYTETDKSKFQSCKWNEHSPRSAEFQPQPSLEQLSPAPKYDNNDIELSEGSEEVKSATCQLVFSQVVVKLICDDIRLPNNDTFYTFAAADGSKTQIFPQDVCAFDCLVTHGVKVEPYGSCCRANDGIMYCKCV